jgi:hypothetical protein
MVGAGLLACAATANAQEAAVKDAAPRRSRVELGIFGVDYGKPLTQAPAERRYDEPTLGLTGELLVGTRYWALGGFLRWGVGGVDVTPSTQSGTVLTGPRLRIGTPLHRRYPSLALELSAGAGLAYAQNLERRPTAVDPLRRERTAGVAYFQLFAAPGLSLLVPVTTTKAGKQLWHVALSAHYHAAYWLTPEARARELSPRWLYFSVGFGGAFLP